MGNGQSISIRDCLDAWAKPFNLEFPVIPAAVICPQNVIEVSETVKCAKQSGLKVQAKSGGHSYGNYGLGGDNGAVSIDLVNLKDFEMDNETWYESFGAGTNLGELDKNLHTFGRRAIAHGTCPSVGTGGHLTVGGLGPISRMWGSALDHVVEMEVVTADGTIYLASQNRTPDLFWAMRGAGASFGIVTRFVVKTRPEPCNIVQYSYSLTLNSQNETADLYKEWQALVGDPTMDRRFASLFVVQPLGALITGTFFGSEAEYQASGIPARLPGASKGAVWLTNWMGHLLHEAEAAGCTLASIPTAFYSKSLSLNEQDLLSDTAITDLFQYLEDSRSKSTPFTIIFNTEGGAMMDTPVNATAYPHRDSVIMYQSYGIGVGKVSAATRKLLDGIHERIQRSAPGARSTYAGYVDAWLDRKAAQELYWADNLPRLQDVKKRWDPDQVFRNPQSVEPAD
ncbi:FAD-linked oxidoreductase sorD [Fusarium oxysporum f. sp. rapae]|uniref:FAD-linked oxidoreductase sorD n=1 Tax=Fusarium oxysporum f. sp. rapae TaxID=485398 RepID=A0A8J5TZ52_FUSOX|nr:FAD-linked oxidoreductase sorD [Fusarium oxysporum f. sp. rapae]